MKMLILKKKLERNSTKVREMEKKLHIVLVHLILVRHVLVRLVQVYQLQCMRNDEKR